MSFLSSDNNLSCPQRGFSIELFFSEKLLFVDKLIIDPPGFALAQFCFQAYEALSANSMSKCLTLLF